MAKLIEVKKNSSMDGVVIMEVASYDESQSVEARKQALDAAEAAGFHRAGLNGNVSCYPVDENGAMTDAVVQGQQPDVDREVVQPVLGIGDRVMDDGIEPGPDRAYPFGRNIVAPGGEADRAFDIDPVGIAVPLVGLVALVVDRDRVLDLEFLGEDADAALFGDAAKVEQDQRQLDA